MRDKSDYRAIKDLLRQLREIPFEPAPTKQKEGEKSYVLPTARDETYEKI